MARQQRASIELGTGLHEDATATGLHIYMEADGMHPVEDFDLPGFIVVQMKEMGLRVGPGGCNTIASRCWQPCMRPWGTSCAQEALEAMQPVQMPTVSPCRCMLEAGFDCA